MNVPEPTPRRPVRLKQERKHYRHFVGINALQSVVSMNSQKIYRVNYTAPLSGVGWNELLATNAVHPIQQRIKPYGKRHVKRSMQFTGGDFELIE